MTLRLRFALWASGLLLAIMAAYGAMVYLNLARGLAASIDDSLRLGASQAAETLNLEDGVAELPSALPESADATDLRERGLTVRILDPKGGVLEASGPYRELTISPDGLARALNGHPDFSTLADPSGGDPVRVYTLPVSENGRLLGFVQAAESLGRVRDTLARLLVSLLLGGPLLAALAGIGGYFLAARALSPIDKITRTAGRISAQDLSARLNLLRTDDEVGRLAATFDEMLGRLDSAFQRERQFTADASHELRTPLAAMSAILSVVREQRRTSEEYEQALRDIAEESDRLRALTEDLLQLARGDLGRPAVRVRVDLSALLSDVADAMRPLAEAKGLALLCHAATGLIIEGDSDNLIRLLVNLLDNAIKYTVQGAVTLAAERDPAGVIVTVADTGPGISPEHLPHIFDRFYRVETARASRGSGLGLAIAREIVSAHGGTISATSAKGQGTTLAVHLPG